MIKVTPSDMDLNDIECNNPIVDGKVSFAASENPNVIYIGKTAVPAADVMSAFGGNFSPGLTAPPSRKFGNPAPLGLCAFALTTFCLSMVNINVNGITNPQFLLGLAYFYGGLIQLLAGMWEIAIENTFGGTALSSYGGFWMSYAYMNTPLFGAKASYGTNTLEHTHAVGIYLAAWFIFTVMLTSMTLRSTVMFFALFFFLSITFMLLTIAHFVTTAEGKSSVGWTQAGGYFGLITAFIAWYNAFAGIATPQNFFFAVRPIAMPWSEARKTQ